MEEAKSPENIYLDNLASNYKEHYPVGTKLIVLDQKMVVIEIFASYKEGQVIVRLAYFCKDGGVREWHVPIEVVLLRKSKVWV